MTIDVSQTTQRMGEYPAPYLAIAGERRTAEMRDTRPVLNPSTGKQLGEIPLATDADLQDALEATQVAFESWSTTTAHERATLLKSAACHMRQSKDAAATRIALELGKNYREAQAEVEQAAQLFENSAEEALRAYGRIIPGRRPGLHLEARLRPIGPVYAVSSWNAPTNTPARKLSGALAAGCTVILKLSDQVPTSGLFVYEALEAAGVPTGVVQVVTGRGAHVSDAILPHPSIKMVTLTGSVQLGRQLASQAAQHLKPQTMELGGHAPAIIWPDTDIQQTAREAARAKFRNVGQVCTAPTRFLVHQNVIDEFTTAFVGETQRIAVGDPFSEATDIGPIQSAHHLAAIEELVEDARQKGATILHGGKRLSSDGFFYEPTVLANVPDDAKVQTTEPFGPVATIEPVADLDEALQRANSLSLGLSAYAFTDSGSVAETIASRIKAGNIVINNWNSSFPETPFGGVEESGYGREGGSEGLGEFQVTIFVSKEFTAR